MKRVHHRRFLADGPRPQGGADDARALHHQQAQIDVGLGTAHEADQHQPAADVQVAQIVHQVSGPHRIEDHVDTAGLRPGLHHLMEVVGVPVGTAVGAQLDTAGDLVGAAGGDEAGVMEGLAHGDRRRADAAGARMQQHALLLLQPGLHVQVQVGSGKHLGNSSGADRVEAARHLQHLPRRHHHLFGIAAAGEQRAHLIARSHATDALAHLEHLARALQAEDGASARRWRVAARALHQIGAIDGGGFDADAHLPGAEFGDRGVGPGEGVVLEEDGFHVCYRDREIAPTVAVAGYQDMRILTFRSWRYCLSSLTR